MGTERSVHLKVCSRTGAALPEQTQLSRQIWFAAATTACDWCSWGIALETSLLPSGWFTDVLQKDEDLLCWPESLGWRLLHSFVISRAGRSDAQQGAEHWAPSTGLLLCCGTFADPRRTRRCPECARWDSAGRSSASSSSHPTHSPSSAHSHLLAKYCESQEGWQGCDWWGCWGVNWQSVVSWRAALLPCYCWDLRSCCHKLQLRFVLSWHLIHANERFFLWLVVFCCNIVF